MYQSVSVCVCVCVCVRARIARPYVCANMLYVCVHNCVYMRACVHALLYMCVLVSAEEMHSLAKAKTNAGVHGRLPVSFFSKTDFRSG